MNWLKEKIKTISAKLNQDDMQSNTNKPESSAGSAFDNIEALKELSIGAITKSVKTLGYSNTVVSGISFHSAHDAGAVESRALESLVKDDAFIKRIKRDFKSKGIKFKEDFETDLIFNSDKIQSLTQVNPAIAIEVLTPETATGATSATVTAIEGITWEAAYQLLPDGKKYYIGRGKDPKIENGPKVHNDIAFIGLEEKNEPQYEINNFVSRSHAYIVYDKKSAGYKLFRSQFLHNPSHKIKVYNLSRPDAKEISLNQPVVPHSLHDGDMITLNDKVVLQFRLQ